MNMHECRFDARLMLAVVAGLAMLALSGCGSVQSIPIKDNNSASMAIRATLRGSDADSGRRAGPGVEIGYESYKAKSDQTLALGQSIVLDGGTFLGPDTLRHEAQLQQAYVSYNHLLRFGPNFEIEPFVGATRVRARLYTEAASGRSIRTGDEWHAGLIGGVTPRWRFNDWLAVEARLSYFNVSAWAHGQSYEAALVLSPAPHVSLRLGYSERKHDVEGIVADLSSELNIRARGPLLTLQFDF